MVARRLKFMFHHCSFYVITVSVIKNKNSFLSSDVPIKRISATLTCQKWKQEKKYWVVKPVLIKVESRDRSSVLIRLGACRKLEKCIITDWNKTERLTRWNIKQPKINYVKYKRKTIWKTTSESREHLKKGRVGHQ